MQRLALLLMLLSLAACQTRLPGSSATGEQVWQTKPLVFSAEQWQPIQLKNWEYTAKVGIVVDGKAEQANLTWRYHDQSNQVRLFGPLGSGAVKLEFDSFGVVLTDNKGRSYSGENAQDLLTEIVGWPLPVNALRYWLFARPTPNAVYDYKLNEVGQILALRQLGWVIDFEDWREYQGQQLPRKVFARRVNIAGTAKNNDAAKSAIGKEITVKLITKSWQWQSP